MHQDFASFIGAWALLLSCVVLVIEPLAHGARWFNRALRLSVGIAGLATFLTARSAWATLDQVKGMVPPNVLAQYPVLWDQAAFQSLTKLFLVMRVIASAVTAPAMTPSSFYRRITGWLAGAPALVSFGSVCVWMSTDLASFMRVPGPISVVIIAAMMSSLVFVVRWGLQRKIDEWWSQLKIVGQQIGQTRVAAWLKSKLLRGDAPTPGLSPVDAAPAACVPKHPDTVVEVETR